MKNEKYDVSHENSKIEDDDHVSYTIVDAMGKTLETYGQYMYWPNKKIVDEAIEELKKSLDERE